MTGQFAELGCTSSSDVACLCANPNFGYGVRDCSAQSCPPGTDISIITGFAADYCSSPAACVYSHCLGHPQLFLTHFLLATGSFSSPGAAITAVTASGTVSDPAETATATPSSEEGEDSTTITSTETETAVRPYSERFPGRITH